MNMRWWLLAAFVLACRTSEPPEWSAYGGDPGGSRHADLKQIDRTNVTRLSVAWTYRTGESEADGAAWNKAAFEATPILADDMLFLSTPFNRVIALDPRTGAEKWKFDPGVDLTRNYSEVTSRGVATWLDRAAPHGSLCRRRILAGTIDARLIALDAATGTLCLDFGESGTVDLSRSIARFRRGDFALTSPPAIIGDLLVIGSSIGDNGGVEMERGVVRAFDARTGALRWSWDPIPSSAEEAPPGSWTEQGRTLTGAANAWAPISVDGDRGLVFVPTSSPSPDFYGGERIGNNAWANSVVALNAADGRHVWHFQVVHHDLWDYDIAAQPLLTTIRRDAKTIPVVMIGTKMGHVFVLHRQTGVPVFPVEERAVPASDVPGEKAWPTQPFPTRPVPLVPQRLRAEDAWGATDEDRSWCRQEIARRRSEGIFTPPSLAGTIAFPGNVGGVNWGGLAFDARRQLLIVPTNRLPFVIRLIPRDRFAEERKTAADNRVQGEFGTQRGTPYGMFRQPLLSPSGVPCNPPPWGALTAIDMTSGEQRWEVPLGFFRGKSDQGFDRFGSVTLGGALLTSGGLAFIASTMDELLRAFDIETGRMLWSATLPASAQATPMSYLIDGRQYVVIAAGGHGKLGTRRGDYVVAFALEKN